MALLKTHTDREELRGRGLEVGVMVEEVEVGVLAGQKAWVRGG